VAVLLGASPAFAKAPAKVARVGVLVAGPPPGEHACVAALNEGLTALGYAEGRTHTLEMRWARGRPEDTFPGLGAELAASRVDVMVAVTCQGLKEARAAIASVPVVMAVCAYPVERGLIASLARPGGNLTGLATFTGELFSKRLQVLTEALPGASRIAILRIPGDQGDLVMRDLERSAPKIGVNLQVIEVKQAADLPAAFQTAARSGAQGVMTTQGVFFVQHNRLIADLALKHKLPSFSGEPGAAEAGALLSHGASIVASCRLAATFVDRILQGATPAVLPVEQPTTYPLVINLRTARALGLTLPPSLLLRADRLIE
jgi:putative ABC transport system substrate-binding protein